jgi:hypothetical protein
MGILQNGVLFAEPRNTPISTVALVQPNCSRVFYATGTTTFAPVYRKGNLTEQYEQSPDPITADINGRFPPIYLDPSLVYRIQLFAPIAQGGGLLEDVDPYVPNPYYVITENKPAPTSRLTVGGSRDPDLTLVIPPPLAPTASYIFEAFLEFTTLGAGTTPGLDFEIVFSGTLVPGYMSSYSFEAHLTASIASAGAVNVPINGLNLAAFPAPNGIFVRGTFTCSTGGFLYVQWGQANASTTAVVLTTGSVFTAQRIA